MRGDAEGTSTLMTMMVRIGNMIWVRFETGRDGYSILIRRSFFVVSSLMIGGWMIVTSAMYEYAATAVAPTMSRITTFGSYWPSSWLRVATKIGVGAAAPPTSGRALGRGRA